MSVDSTAPQVPRTYWLDWTRITAIYLVVTYHVVQALDWVGLWCGNQKDHRISFSCMALQVGMPLFFHISGRAQAMGKPVRLRKAILVRFLRLVVPFFICFAMLVPTWHWIHLRSHMSTCAEHVAGSSYAYNTLVGPNADVPQGLKDFLTAYWLPPFSQFMFDPAWLWFLPILFLVTVSGTPLFLYAEFGEKKYLVITVLWCVLQASLAMALGYDWMFAVYVAAAPLGTVLMVERVPLPQQKTDYGERDTQVKRWVAVRLMTALHVVCTVGLAASFKYAAIHDDRLKTVPGVFGYPLFYVQGFFSERWWPERMSSKLYRRNTRLTVTEEPSPSYLTFNSHQMVMVWELLSVFLSFICIFIGSPVGMWEFNSWPVYSNSFQDGETMYPQGFVLGTWAWIGLVEGFMQAYAEKKVDPWLHHHASASTIVVYVFHWMFIKMWVWWVIRDFNLLHGFWKYFAVFSTFAVGVGGSLAVYAVLDRTPCLGQMFGLQVTNRLRGGRMG